MFDEYGHFIGTIPQECVDDCTQPGQDASSSVKYWRKKLGFVVPRDKATSWIREFGAWEDEELEEKSDEGIAEIVLWTACSDIKETGEFFGLTH